MLFPTRNGIKTVRQTTFRPLLLKLAMMADSEEEVGVLDGPVLYGDWENLIPLRTSSSCSTESETDKQADQEVRKILVKWNSRKLPGSGLKGGPVEKKLKIESASVSAKEDVNGQYFSLKSVTQPSWIKRWLKKFLNQVSFKLTDQYCTCRFSWNKPLG